MTCEFLCGIVVSILKKSTMKITKDLKYASFTYDEEFKDFTITEEDGNKVILNKVYAFAFMRFVIRMAQRNWLRQIKKSKKTDTKIEAIEPELEDLEQLVFSNYDGDPLSTEPTINTHVTETSN